MRSCQPSVGLKILTRLEKFIYCTKAYSTAGWNWTYGTIAFPCINSSLPEPWRIGFFTFMISWLDLWPPLHLPVEVYKIGTCRNVPSIVTTQPPAPIPDLGTYNFRDWGARLEASSSGLSRFFWSRREFFGGSFAWGRPRQNFDKPSKAMTSRVDSLLRSKKNLKK